eukprot:SAG11_NODE_18767_length_481_cov_8.649215_1_plen_107_part_10
MVFLSEIERYARSYPADDETAVSTLLAPGAAPAPPSSDSDSNSDEDWDSIENVIACGLIRGNLCEICGSDRDNHDLHLMADGRSFLLPCEANLIPPDGADPECECGI